jgi:TRAP-type C4-dicarboxylate transport system permease small subunit
MLVLPLVEIKMIRLVPKALAQDWPLPRSVDVPELKGFEFADATLGDIISALLPYLFVIAGLGIFGALIYSGFQLMISAGDPKRTEQAKGCLTSTVAGAVIIFVAYWLIRIIQHMFGLTGTF